MKKLRAFVAALLASCSIYDGAHAQGNPNSLPSFASPPGTTLIECYNATTKAWNTCTITNLFTGSFASPPQIGSTTPNRVFILGTTAADNAASGVVGEYFSQTFSAVSTPNATNTNATSFTVPAGDWDVCGLVTFTLGASGSMTGLDAGFNTVSATLPAASFLFQQGITIAANGTTTAVVPCERFNFSTPTTVYFIVTAFTSATTTANGIMRGRRIR